MGEREHRKTVRYSRGGLCKAVSTGGQVKPEARCSVLIRKPLTWQISELDTTCPRVLVWVMPHPEGSSCLLIGTEVWHCPWAELQGKNKKSQTANLGPQTWFPLGQIEYKEANLLLFIVSKDRPKICLFWKESSLALLPQLVLGPWQYFLSGTARPPEHTWTTCKATRDPFPWVACGYTCAQGSFFIWRWIGGFRAWIGFMTSNSFHPFQKSRPKYNNKKI